MSPWRLSFKYKLALSASTLILGVVASVFLLIENLMEKYVTAEIEKDLAGTRMSVARLMEERRARLNELAVALAGDTLIRTILTDKNIDRVTRDDILDSEILSNYPQLKMLAVLDTDGSIKAINQDIEGLATKLRRHAPDGRGLSDRPATGFLSTAGSFLQVAVIPVRIGPAYARDLMSIRELSHAEVAFFDGAGAFLSSGPPFTPQTRAADLTRMAPMAGNRSVMLQSGSERFIVVKVDEPDEVSPPYMIARSLDQQMAFLNRMRRWLIELGIGGILVGCGVSFLLALGISRPVHTLQAALRRVAHGDFRQPVTIRSRDEFSELAATFNRMQTGLAEREKMKQALLMAEEVQRSLLPDRPPREKHLDIAGASLYCNAIGGDYYDFFEGPQGSRTIRIALGDVCGHGTAAALLMASSRALLRSRAMQAGSIEEIITDVNRELSRDMKETGRFITLFFVEIDTVQRRLRWVRAGHDPAILFHPATDTFENLAGPGTALGIDADRSYIAQTKNDLVDGQILMVGTDGIWEARNTNGDMFGKDRVYWLLRRHAEGSAQQIADAVLDHLKQFKSGSDFEDDVTLVVVKILSPSGLPA
jgi:serine phosphatase RsbU (regulator of sigma subunit)